MATLYRTYRPQSFGEVVGQPQVTEPLTTALKQKKTVHAYLFHGPRGTGKTTTARILAAGMNGRSPSEGELDLIEIDAASNRGIDDVRELKQAAATRPTTGEYKVYIVDEVHMLSRDAFAALLKLMEEPPKHVVFVLATTELHKVPDTIISRCQVYRFKRASTEEMQQRLQYILKKEKRELDDDALQFIIQRSDGCYRDAESLLGQVLGLDTKEITRDEIVGVLGLPPQSLVEQFALGLVNDDAPQALEAADTAYADGFDPDQLLAEAITMIRDWAVAVAKGEETPVSEKQARLAPVLRALLQARQDLAVVPQPLLAIEVAVVTVCAAKTPSAMPAAAPVATTTTLPVEKTSSSPEEKNEAATPASFSLEQVLAIWPKLIEDVKKSNPVAATFLRALKPTAATGNQVSCEARYALHKNFFTKAQNAQPVNELLSELLGGTAVLAVSLVEQKDNGASLHERRSQKEDELVAAAKEIFG